MKPAASLYDLTLADLNEEVTRLGEPAYRARQIFQTLHRRFPAGWDSFSGLPKGLRAALSARFSLRTLTEVECRQSADGTVKWLSRLCDGELLETVLIPSGERRTVCVSTQVGCAYGCAFCASGMNGFRRNLSPGEMVQQVLLASQPKRVSNVVFMGMGEPLANYDNLLKAIRVINAPEGFHLGARRITISTVGLVPMIERLAKEGLQVELSVSLHAPNDEIRGRIMPVNRRYPVKELIHAARAYSEATRRLITFEYILIDGVNEAPEQARELAQLLKGLLCKVNLIPCHPIPATPWGRPPLTRMKAFEAFLKRRKIPCTLRRSRGLDIEGACGQLRIGRIGGHNTYCAASTNSVLCPPIKGR